MVHNTLTVLLVEDVLLAQKMATLLLEQLGCQVVLAKTGAEAIQLASEQTFHVIFMDLGLPDIDGITVAETIKKNENRIPIVALTANSDQQTRDACLNADFEGFIAKPLTLDNAREVIEKYRPAFTA